MPQPSSHLLQPLDVGCFPPFMRAYGSQVSGARYSITHVDKIEFLAAFNSAFLEALRKENICGSLRGAGLVPFDPDTMLSRLDVKLRPLIPPAPEDTIWESKTPRTARE